MALSKKVTDRASGMVARYLPANQAWCVMFGDSMISIDGQSLFSTSELSSTLAGKGLAIDGKTGQIYTPEVNS